LPDVDEEFNSDHPHKKHNKKHELPSWAVWLFGFLICSGAGAFIYLLKGKDNDDQVNYNLRDDAIYDRPGNTGEGEDIESRRLRQSRGMGSMTSGMGSMASAPSNNSHRDSEFDNTTPQGYAAIN